MSHVHRIRCDGCNREADQSYGHRAAPNGWYIVDGEWGGGEPYDQYHACSLDCLIAWANRHRISRWQVTLVESDAS